MKLQVGTTYKVTHHLCPNMQVFVTCLDSMTHVSVYNTHDNYYRNTEELERVFDKSNFELTEIQL